METGEIEPLDLCSSCLWGSYRIETLESQIILGDGKIEMLRDEDG